MSSESSVGFAFQADVANTGSLLHLLTGKALKALSDGGVDFYSVVAAITLGKSFEVRNSLGNTIPALVKSKRGIQSVLSKVLSIGWGQPELAVAMAQTKAGVNALVLINAIAYGSTYYQAAECFSNLLSLRGCEADKLPNVDVLKHMIGYLAPLLLDSGFSRVVAHITTTATRAINLNQPRDPKFLEYIERAGDASSVAGAISQLMLTSGRKESSYIPIRMRGAWFSAFASHILGMAVELRLNNAIIWESAGSNGTAIFELGEYQANDSHFQTIIGQRVTIIESPNPENQESILYNYLPIDMVFASLISREPRIDISLQQDIHREICRLCLEILKSELEVYYSRHKYLQFRKIFKTAEALKETLNAFGFEDSVFDSVENQPVIEEAPNFTNRLLSLCDGNRGIETNPQVPHKCSELCDYVIRLVYGFAFSARCLARCQFDASQLYIYPDILLDFGNTKRYSYHCPETTEDDLWSILFLVEKNPESILTTVHALGYSGRDFTVCYTCILSYDCFDNQGRFLTILPGRASVAGAFRSIILEKNEPGIPARFSRVPVSTLLAPGLSLMPHHAPSESNIFMDVYFDEKAISLSFKVGYEKASAVYIGINSCIEGLVKAQGASCLHEPTSEFQVQNDQNLAIVGFGALGSRNQNATQLIALHGNKLEQLLTFGMIKSYNMSFEDVHHTEFIFQLTACLKCSIATAKNEGCEFVVMGG